MTGDDLAQLTFLGLLLAWLGWSFVRSGNIGPATRNLLAWLLIAVGLVGAYAYRAELQDVGHRVTLGLIPGSSVTRLNDDGTARVDVGRDRSGHFIVDASVDGTPISFLVDTGATTIALSYRDAMRAGIDPDRLRFDLPIRTANGTANAARVQLESVTLGGIERRNLTATVSEPRALGQSLLGMNFLGSLASFEIRGDRLLLSD